MGIRHKIKKRGLITLSIDEGLRLFSKLALFEWSMRFDEVIGKLMPRKAHLSVQATDGALEYSVKVGDGDLGIEELATYPYRQGGGPVHLVFESKDSSRIHVGITVFFNENGAAYGECVARYEARNKDARMCLAGCFEESGIEVSFVV